ncbi:uncharacterized protein LOC117170801 [Belonocnema kinseyi]|uniref:uncharacterized protein LOC117170801 n=1 Tax=Belonocnema kinseyi TaxID=2817044 RepID=UPI00143D5699|nr:uncharacterized protein LOC117170801 [Belonocnema kinseyi]
MDVEKIYGSRLKHVEAAAPQDDAVSEDDAFSDDDDNIPLSQIIRRELVIYESSEEWEPDVDDDVASEIDDILDNEAEAVATRNLRRTAAQTPTNDTQQKQTFPGRQQSKKKDPIRWTNTNLLWSTKDTEFTGVTDLPTGIAELYTPFQFLYYIFGREISQKIADETNLYAMQQRPEKMWSVTREEIKQFLGTLLFMSLTQKPFTRDYWSSVRPVDEQIVPFKERSCLKQYNPKKPHNWGYKVLVLSGVSGISYEFEIFTGASYNNILPNEPDLGLSSNVVMRLSRSIPRGQNYVLCFDNWFSSPGL